MVRRSVLSLIANCRAGPNQEGIYFDGAVGKWQASIKLEDSLVDLGAYATCMEAAIAFTTAAQILQLASTAQVQGGTVACHHSQSCNAKQEAPTIGLIPVPHFKAFSLSKHPHLLHYSLSSALRA